jgi:hypothetical protein
MPDNHQGGTLIRKLIFTEHSMVFSLFEAVAAPPVYCKESRLVDSGLHIPAKSLMSLISVYNHF